MDYEPIDHKDRPGEYRSEVRLSVFHRVGSTGANVTSRQQIVGGWAVNRVDLRGGKHGKPILYRLRADGQAIIEMEARPPSTRNEWRLNGDGTFSLMVWCEALPEDGLPLPTLEEIRMHAAALENGKLLLWNGDGSLVMLLSRAAGDGVSGAD